MGPGDRGFTFFNHHLWPWSSKHFTDLNKRSVSPPRPRCGGRPSPPLAYLPSPPVRRGGPETQGCSGRVELMSLYTSL